MMQKLKKAAAEPKRVMSAASTKNGASRKPAKAKSRVGTNGSTTRKPLLIHGGPRSKAVHVTEKATAREIYKALGVKSETVKRVQQIIRDLEAKSWQVD